MPLVNYLVEVDLPEASPQSLMDLASDIEDAVSSIADVKSVKPWARPSLGLTPDLIQQQAPPASQPFTPPA